MQLNAVLPAHSARDPLVYGYMAYRICICALHSHQHLRLVNAPNKAAKKAPKKGKHGNWPTMIKMT